MSDRFDRMEKKLDKIDDHLSNIDVTLGKQAVELEHHIRRTEIAEEQLTLIREEIQPLKKQKIMFDTVFKIIGIAASFIAFIAGVYKGLE